MRTWEDAVNTVAIAAWRPVPLTVSQAASFNVLIKKLWSTVLNPVLILMVNFLLAFVAKMAETASTNAPVAMNNLDFFIKNV
jgi:hypothetical protein